MTKRFCCIVFMLCVGASAWADTSGTQVFIDRGVLYGVSETAILKSNLRTGELSITYADGSTFYDNRPAQSRKGGQSAMLKHLPEPFWIKGGLAGTSGGPEFSPMVSDCSSEANALQSAIDAAQAACAGDDSTACNDAQTLVDSAYSAYKACLRHYLEMQ